jgi:ABC-type multidrug transport system ATPase subunit
LETGGNNVIKEDGCFWLGGCKLTAIQGPSGSGKLTFLHLLSGHHQSNMTLSVGEFVSRPPIIICQQSADIWPEEMLVQDILLFACAMFGAKTSSTI